MTEVEFRAPLAWATNYPIPHISATPIRFHWQPWGESFKYESQFNHNSVFTKNGRSALAYIIKDLGLNEHSCVLLPEYHCPAMIEPFIWANVNVNFYPLNDDLSVNLEKLGSLIKQDTSAVLLVRFFGFETNIAQALTLAKNSNVKVVEDCAHAFFSEQLNVGDNKSDASFCSLNKFFSCFDGGVLRTGSEKTKSMVNALAGPGLKAEVKYTLGKSELVSATAKLVKQFFSKPLEFSTPVKESCHVDTEGFRYFDINDLDQQCYSMTKLQLYLENFGFVAQKRRNNYQHLYDGLIDSAHGNVVFSLDENTVPYVFPFLLNDKQIFENIRNKGIQVLRWEEYCESSNALVESYRECMVQIPCHQDLSIDQLDFIIKTINKV